MPHSHSPIQAWHLAHQAVLTPVAGWEMPLHFALGTQAEHLHTRTKAGLSDFSHMAKFLLEGNGATAALGRCITANLATLKPGRCRYGFLLNDAGGIQDDLIVYRLEDEKYLLVLNPENTAAKFAELQSAMPAPWPCTTIRKTQPNSTCKGHRPLPCWKLRCPAPGAGCLFTALPRQHLRAPPSW